MASPIALSATRVAVATRDFDAALQFAGVSPAAASGGGPIGVLVFTGDCSADGYVANQRGAALIASLFDSPTPISHVGLVVTAGAVIVLVASDADVSRFHLPSIGDLKGAATSEGCRNVPVCSLVSLGDANAATAALQVVVPGSDCLAVVPKEVPMQVGPLASALALLLQKHYKYPAGPIDAGNVVTSLLLTKDAQGIENTRRAAALCTSVLHKVVAPDLQRHFTSQPPATTAADFAAKIGDLLSNPHKIKDLEKLINQAYGLSLAPSVQSASGGYDIRHTMRAKESVATPMSADCVVIAYACSFRGYSAFAARTFIAEANCPPGMSEAYRFLHMLSDKVIELLKPGVTLKAVYDATKLAAEAANPALAAHLTSDVGFGVGLVLHDARSVISNKNENTIVRPGMTLAVRVGLVDVSFPATPGDVKQEAATLYSLLLGDTVYLTEDHAELSTRRMRAPGEVIYSATALRTLAQAADQANHSMTRTAGAVDGAIASALDGPRDLKAITRSAKAATAGSVHMSNEEARRERQKKLVADKHAAWIASGGKRETEAETEEYRVSDVGRLAKGELQPFGADGRLTLPATLASGAVGLDVDRSREVLWLPIAGANVPFAIATVQKVEVRSHSSTIHQLVVTFHSSQESNLAFRCNRNKVFVREATVTAGDAARLNSAANAVREIAAVIKSRDAQRKQQQGVVAQGGLKLKSGLATQLPSVKCRPPPVTGGKNGCEGNLAIHANGFRFEYAGGPALDILLSSVKHVIYQPSKNDICTILHFALKHPIMVGKKKTEHVQFVAEVIETSEKLSGRRMTHEEEVDAEERDIERIERTNSQFAKFALEIKRQLLAEPEWPADDFSVEGVASRSMARLRGSANCLWTINELPFFVLSLREVEVAALERVMPGQKNFDVSFAKTDLKTVVPITTISMESLDKFKDYLTEAGVVYFESTMNLQWANVLKVIRDDKEFEPWGAGGWTATIEGGDSDDSDDEDGDDSSYDEEDDSDADDSDDSDWAEEASSDEVSSAADDSDDSDALSWDEMDRRAQDEDRKKGRSDDGSGDDSDRPKKKKARKDAPPPQLAAAAAGPPMAARPAAAPPSKLGMPLRPGMAVARPAGAPPAPVARR